MKQRQTHLSEDAIKAVAVHFAENGLVFTADNIQESGRLILHKWGDASEEDIDTITNVSTAYGNGTGNLPTKVTIFWYPVLRVVARDHVADNEDLVRRLVDERFQALVRGTHSKLTNGELFDRETVADLRNQLDIATNANTVLQMREAATNNELASMRDEADRTKRTHQRDISQLNATVKSLQRVYSFADGTGTMLDSYNTLARQDEIACRLVLRAAANLFPGVCDDLKQVSDYDLATYHFNDKPDHVKNFIHTTLDNLIAAGMLHHVTRQMMYAMHVDALGVDKHETIKTRGAFSKTNHVEDIAESDTEHAYKAFRDIVNGADEVRS